MAIMDKKPFKCGKCGEMFEIMTDLIKFFQINLNKCQDAQANLMAELSKLRDKSFICLIQEPHFYRLKPLIKDSCKPYMVKALENYGQEL